MSDEREAVTAGDGLTGQVRPPSLDLPSPDVESAGSVRRLRLPVLSGPVVGLLAILGLFVLLLAWKGELRNFLSLGNLQVLLHTTSVVAVVALGMLLIIVSGGIDLSVGSVVALVTVVAMQVYRLVQGQTDAPQTASLAAVGAGLAVAGLCGLLNGLAITGLRVTPFVVTLGMLSIARGLAFWLSARTVVNFPGARPDWVVALSRARADAFVFDPGVWSALVLAGGVWVLLRYTVFGRYCYAIGSNEATARLCGVPVERYKVAIYTLAGLLTGWAGILAFAHGGAGDPNARVGLELDVIAAVVIGGASLSGGQGTVVGTLLGVLILGVLENGVSFSNVPIEVKYILIGAIVVVNTALSQWQRRRGE
jgi:ribose transport system permease protein